MDKQRVGAHQVACFGKPQNYRVGDWSNSASFLPLAQSLQGLGLDACCIARPSFGGQLLRVDQLALGHHLLNGADIKIRTSIDLLADALFLPAGMIGAIAPADCPTLVLSNRKTKEAVLVHCGRDAVLPIGQRLQPVGEFYGVIDNVLRSLTWNLASFSCGIFLGVAATHFSHPIAHPVYGERNKNLINFVIKSYGQHCVMGEEANGCIDLIAIIKHKLQRFGISAGQIFHDGIDTALPENIDVWWSVRRDGDKGRNLIVVF